MKKIFALIIILISLFGCNREDKLSVDKNGDFTFSSTFITTDLEHKKNFYESTEDIFGNNKKIVTSISEKSISKDSKKEYTVYFTMSGNIINLNNSKFIKKKSKDHFILYPESNQKPSLLYIEKGSAKLEIVNNSDRKPANKGVYENLEGHLSIILDNKITDKNIILEKIDNLTYLDNDSPLENASDTLKNDREVVLEAVKKDGSAISFANESLKQDREIALIAVEESYGYAFDDIGSSLKNNKDFVIEALSISENIYMFLSDDLKNDPEILFIAYKKLILLALFTIIFLVALFIVVKKWDKKRVLNNKTPFGFVRLFNFTLIGIVILAGISNALLIGEYYFLGNRVDEPEVFIGVPAVLLWIIIGFPLYIYKFVQNKKNSQKVFIVDYLYFILTTLVTVGIIITVTLAILEA